MNWEELINIKQLERLKEQSFQAPVLFFKHSTRCSISAMALNRFGREWDNEQAQPYLLDLLNYREISDQITDEFGVEHQSPQVLLIKNGICVYNASHNLISASIINEYC
ncbi:MAG: bacillithiol system redox-active protein YtxJ [Rhodobacteraceae bacterium]|nr:bacillithiol system redox-active protein YtxJ [Paracoccaceae bacterium]